ncbi:MAG TPA: hypothetical protein VEY30_13780, partial [Myxococcaceae bacterium]|nr:hypothetical protein [Myxococcaceae bacterium]
GFESVRFKGVASHEVTHAIPLSGARGTIFAQRADGNGRPLCYAFREADAPQGAEQRRVVDAEFMARSINVRMLSEGHAYPGVYTSTPVPHRKPLADAVQAARGRSLGVWARDSSRAFTLESQASIGPGGQLIFPKLFRRCTDYLVSVSKGFTGTLPEWFEAVGRLSRGEAERVWVGDQERHFAELLAQTGSRVTFTADLLDLVFQENP